MKRRIVPVHLYALFVLILIFTATPPAGAYSVLSHEEVVDMAWKPTLIPMLRARFPGITDEDLRQAHAYAYGGSVIQDIGYYPFGSHYFSDLLHYVRPQDFVNALIRDSTTPDEFAFALGALAHYCGDTIGHPAVNKVTALENPPLTTRFGKVVTYADDPTAHIRTEFGFDVVEVAQGNYSQQNYRDFIGFQVSKPLLERAFLETYGIPMNSVITHEDLAISTYRHAVSSIIPNMTRLAFANYKDQIEQAAPGTQKRKFLYRLNRTEYQKDFGTDYTHVGFGGRVLALFLRIVPKVGPFKALKVTIANSQEQTIYLKSINDTVDKYTSYLAQIKAPPAPLPPPDPQAAADAAKAAAKVNKDAATAEKRAESAQDPGDKAMKEKAAANVEQAAVKADALADKAQAQVAATQAATAAGVPPPTPAGALPPDSPILPPTTPKLPSLDLDTGKPSAAGEYTLADATYAHLLDDLVKRAAKPPTASGGSDTPAGPPVDPALAANIEQFYAHPVPPSAPPAVAPSPKAEAKRQAQVEKVQANLAALKSLESTATPAAQPTAPSQQ